QEDQFTGAAPSPEPDAARTSVNPRRKSGRNRPSRGENQRSAANDRRAAPPRHSASPAKDDGASPNRAGRPPRPNASPNKPRPQRQREEAAASPSSRQEPSEIQHTRNLDMTGWQVPQGQRATPETVLFQDFELDPRILRALLEDMGFQACSPIQGKALPHVLAGKDLAGRAQTGTGKTAAFLVSIIQRFLQEEKDSRDPWQPFSLILAPTRELAIQIAKDAEDISAYCPDFKITAVYGGMDFDRQMSSLAQGVDLVVATPGRLIDYLRRHAVDLSKVSIMVIDEADRMLDMGFIPDVKRIFGYLSKPEQRQTMLFSATLTPEIMRLAAAWMRPAPVIIEIEPEHVVAEGIQETTYAVSTAEKMPVLLWTLKHEDCRRVLIFRNRRRDVEDLANLLRKCHIPCEMLTGDVEQKKRLRILEDFRNGNVKYVVATDVAGRGIHVDDITHVINYDFPYEAEDYVHRIGRTARAGHQGRAINFADEDSAFTIPAIEEFIERPLPITQPDDEMLAVDEATARVLAANRTDTHHSRIAHGNRYGGRSSAPRRGGAPRRRR
ncbi:MAG: DEAD/DEAH box helicase, partial [Victivallales bacterium]|nr:DEAD/DEAH box helicase [Victivallales bacterium]